MSRRRKEEESKEKSTERAISEPKKPRVVERILTFDAYFQMMLKSGRAFPHHKAPMRNFASQYGLLEGTEKDFKDLFSRY